MKKIVTLFSCLLVLLSCKNTPKENGTETEKPKLSDGAYSKSAGRTNSLTIVIDNLLWEGEVGDELRKCFAAGVPGFCLLYTSPSPRDA